MFGGDVQWGRYAEVTFTNFHSGLVTTIRSDQIDENNKVIGDGLRIAFEYSKNDDEGYNTPNGKITIYGLTEKTFNALGERLNCEVEVKAGYLESKANSPKRVIYAVLMNKAYDIKDGVSVATFDILGDFIEKVIAHKMSMNLPKPTLIDIMTSIANAMNKDFAMSISGTDEEQAMLADYIQKWKVAPYGYSFAGTPQQELKRIRQSFGIAYRVDKDTVVFSILDNWFSWHLDGAKQISALQKQRVDTTLVAENKTATKVKDFKPVDKAGKPINLIKTHSLFLSPNTGLLGTPTMTTEIVDKKYDEGLASGEEVWSKKQQKVLRDKEGKARTDKKTGEVKLSKKPKTYKAARRTVNCRCQLNSMLDFNSMVTIQTESGICDGLYRVRSIKINCDTEGTWEMELKLNE